MSGASKQVRTFTTPGTASAADVSTDLTKPWAMVEWQIFAIKALRSQRSSMYLARPVAFS